MWWSARHPLFSLAAFVSMVCQCFHVACYPKINTFSRRKRQKPKFITVLISQSSATNNTDQTIYSKHQKQEGDTMSK